MYKSYKFRLYPNKEQKEIINKEMDSCRFIYNYFLNKIIETYYTSIAQNTKYYINYLKYKFPFLQESNEESLIKTLYILDNNLKRCTSNQQRFPKFKSKYKRNSYFIKNLNKSSKSNDYYKIELDLMNRVIKLPKLKNIKVRGYKNIEHINGKILSVTISKESDDKYYVSVLYEMNEKIKKVIPTSIVGIDIGVKKLLTLSDGNTYENNKYIEKHEKQIKRMQRKLSKKVKGSNNYYKYKKKLAILHNKIANSRKHYIHKITKNITNKYDIIVCETLHTKEMIIGGKKNTLSKHINDASFNEILRQLEYKSRFKGKQFYQIYDYYPSSQICSSCNKQDKKYKNLNERIYKCTNCHLEMDRDLNASINIMFEGLKMHIKNYKN